MKGMPDVSHDPAVTHWSSLSRFVNLPPEHRWNNPAGVGTAY
jgi:hypothetical protein